MICTPQYASKANSRSGGVGYEASIITPELATNTVQRKFVPVLRIGTWEAAIPVWLRSKIGVDLRSDPYSERGYELLLRNVHEVGVEVPPLGNRPIFSVEAAVTEKSFDLGSKTDWELRRDQGDPIPTSYQRIAMSDLEAHLKRRLHRQAIAVECVLPWIKRALFGLYRDDKPQATFLFVGHTGVGKTELAKEMAAVLCGGRESLIIFDMGEYSDPMGNVMLLGAPPGYVGFKKGRLVNALRESPQAFI